MGSWETIRKIYERKREEREKLRREMIRKVLKALDKLSENVEFEEAVIFGSIVKPFRFTERSDVDVAFKGLERDKLFYTTAFLSGEIGRDVVVVELERVRFADRITREGLRWRRGSNC
jgi:predicted nucleotidyltransferase